jgi:cell shape-determining protein MreC
LKENQILKDELNNEKGKNNEYFALLKKNQELKEILGRTDENKDTILASILVNNQIFDTFIIDIGENQNIKQGDLVFAYGNIPVGRIAEVYSTSSKVNLFSKAKEKTSVIIQSKNIYIDLIGRGGGNFEIILPRDLVLEKGENVLLPDIDTYLIAKVDSIISDPRDSFQKALLTTPVNINQLRFVQVVK